MYFDISVKNMDDIDVFDADSKNSVPSYYKHLAEDYCCYVDTLVRGEIVAAFTEHRPLQDVQIPLQWYDDPARHRILNLSHITTDHIYL